MTDPASRIESRIREIEGLLGGPEASNKDFGSELSRAAGTAAQGASLLGSDRLASSELLKPLLPTSAALMPEGLPSGGWTPKPGTLPPLPGLRLAGPEHGVSGLLPFVPAKVLPARNE